MAKQELTWKNISPDMVVFQYVDEVENVHEDITVRDVQQYLDFLNVSLQEDIEQCEKDGDDTFDDEHRDEQNILLYLAMVTLRDADRQARMIRTLGKNRPFQFGIDKDGDTFEAG